MSTVTRSSETKSAARRRAKNPFTKYLVLYLALTIGSVWALTVFMMIDYDMVVSVIGELELTNPVVIIILHSPAIAALIVLFAYDGWRGIANFARTLVPRRKDLIWLGGLMLIMAVYIFAVRYLAMLFGIEVPAEPIPPLDMLLTFLSMFVMEIGMVAIAIGWFGFFLPYMHRVTGSRVWAGVATGVGIGVFVAPGNIFASFELATAWPLYVTQLVVLSIGMSMLLTVGKGNILFFLLPFWVSASGSWLGLYNFDKPTQLVQLGLFSTLVVVLWLVLRRRPGGLAAPHTFPEYLENEYTTAQVAPIPGRGNRSQELVALAEAESVTAVGQAAE